MRPNTTLIAAAILAAALHTVDAAAQTSCPAKGAPIASIGAAGARYCCTLGQNSVSGGGALDPKKLGGHQYGRSGFTTALGTEPMGFVYTANAGLLDLGHVRDNADMTRSIYFDLITSNSVLLLNTPLTSVIIPNIPKDPAMVLDFASAVTYVASWQHELDTWEDNAGPVPQDPSSFSPEDLPSNIVGIELARRVIQSANYANQTDDEFNHCVDLVIS